MAKSIEDLIDKVDEKKKKIERFSDLLDELENTEDKKKYLWKEIYENAINDRKGSTGNHAIYGPIMSKYLERMSKSNDQILRLAEIISKEEQEPVDPNLIFDQIGG